MKRAICLILILLTVLQINALSEAYSITAEDISSDSAMLIDAMSGRVLFEKNSTAKHAIASLTKIMTALITFEEIDSGKLNLTDLVTAGEYTPEGNEVHIYISPGEQLTVSDLLKAMLLPSANDACVVMAEHIAGSKKAFVERMNNRAEELGMKNTHFANTNGLSAQNHYSTAFDVAIMVRELIRHSKVFDFTTIWNDTIRNGSFQVTNTNIMLNTYDGMNGLKTGYTTEAGYCFVGTAERDGISLISIQLGAPSSADRFSDTKKLLDYGFDNFELKQIGLSGEAVADIKIKRGLIKKYRVTLENDCYALVKKTEGDNYKKEVTCEESLKAPIAAGTSVGNVVYYSESGEPLTIAPLKISEDIPKIRYKDAWILLFKGFLGLR